MKDGSLLEEDDKLLEDKEDILFGRFATTGVWDDKAAEGTSTWY